MATHSSILAWEIPWTEEPNSKILYIYIYLGGRHKDRKKKNKTERLKIYNYVKFKNKIKLKKKVFLAMCQEPGKWGGREEVRQVLF